MFEVVGTLIRVENIQKISDNFTTKEFVIRTEGPFPQCITLKLINDHCYDLVGIDLNTEIRCNFSLRGREWNGHADGKPRYFNTLECWKIKRVDAE